MLLNIYFNLIEKQASFIDDYKQIFLKKEIKIKFIYIHEKEIYNFIHRFILILPNNINKSIIIKKLPIIVRIEKEEIPNNICWIKILPIIKEKYQYCYQDIKEFLQFYNIKINYN